MSSALDPFPADVQALGDVVALCQRRKCKFVDGAFAPSAALLHNPALQGVEWLRPEQFMSGGAGKPVFLAGKMQERSAVQGQVGDCWFLGPLNAAAKHPNAFKHVFDSGDRYAEHGVYAFRFFRNGQWLPVVVDDLIPCVERKPLYVRSTEALETWPLLLEKAYAKLHGSYKALHNGIDSAALADLTGCPVQYLFLCTRKSDLATRDAVWEQLVAFRERNDIMTCTSVGSLGRQCSPDILRYHTYTVLDVRVSGQERLVRVQNPWGKSEWSGAWSHAWGGWTAGLRQELDAVRATPGVFWMAWDDFYENFDFLCVAHTVHAKFAFQPVAVQGRWTETTAGGWYPAQRFFDNPQYALTVSKDATVVAMFEKAERHFGGVWVFDMGDDEPRMKLRDRTSLVYRVVAQSDVSNRRVISADFAAQAGHTYVLVPFLVNNGVQDSFTLSVRADTCKVDLRELANGVVTAVEDEFTLKSAGGTPLSERWATNPQFRLVVGASGGGGAGGVLLALEMRQELDQRIVDIERLAVAQDNKQQQQQQQEQQAQQARASQQLTAAEAAGAAGSGAVRTGASMLSVDLDALNRIGFCVYRAAGDGAAAARRTTHATEDAVAHSEDWLLNYGVRAGTVSCTWVADAGEYTVVCNTGSQKERGLFTLHAYSPAGGVELEPLP